MSNYEQMELNITLDGERELKENVMLSIEFAYDQLKISKRHPLCTIQLRRSFILRQTWQHTSTRL